MAITGFTLGLSILVGQRFGGGRTDSVPQVLSTFSVTLGVFFAILAAVGIWLTSPILHLLHTTPDTVLLAEAYLRIIFLGIPFLAVYNVYSAALRGMGDSRAPFLAVLISSVVNVALDLYFVAVLHWGVSGAAIATVVSQAAMTVFIILYAIKKYPVLRFRLRRGIVDRQTLAGGLRFGIPPMIQSSVSAFGSLLLQNFMNGFGTQTVAAITTAYRIDSIALLPIINLGSGISTIVAQSYGAGEEKKTRKIYMVGTVLMAVVSVLMTVLVVPVGGPLIALFGAGPEAVEIGRGFFQRLASFYVVYGLATATRGYLEGIGDVVYSSVAGIVSLACRIIASYAFAGVFGNSIIAYAEAFSWGILLLLYVARMLWKRAQARPPASNA